jgi:hypothetical protein
VCDQCDYGSGDKRDEYSSDKSPAGRGTIFNQSYGSGESTYSTRQGCGDPLIHLSPFFPPHIARRSEARTRWNFYALWRIPSACAASWPHVAIGLFRPGSASRRCIGPSIYASRMNVNANQVK